MKDNRPALQYSAHESAIIESKVIIGQGTKVWHFCKLMGPSAIGENCVLGQNVVIERNVTIGDRVKIQNNVSVYRGVTLEDDVFCGPSMVFTNVSTPRSHYPRREKFEATYVGKGASIGANATIVCGVTIGRYAMVGAGAVVTKDVPDYTLVLGVPARPVGYVCYCGERLPIEANKVSQTIECHECGRAYDYTDEVLTPK